jgi:hypothetical protein
VNILVLLLASGNCQTTSVGRISGRLIRTLTFWVGNRPPARSQNRERRLKTVIWEKLSRNDSVERRFSAVFLFSCLQQDNCMAVGRRGEFGQYFPPPVAMGGPAHGQFERVGFAARPAPDCGTSKQPPAQGV